MNTINDTQYSNIWNALYELTEKESLPDFWSIMPVDSLGNSCNIEAADYIELEVQDFDGHHDFGFLRSLLAEHGVALDMSDMLCSYDLVRLEEEEEPRPRKAALVDGDGEYGRLYGVQLIRA